MLPPSVDRPRGDRRAPLHLRTENSAPRRLCVPLSNPFSFTLLRLFYRVYLIAKLCMRQEYAESCLACLKQLEIAGLVRVDSAVLLSRRLGNLIIDLIEKRVRRTGSFEGRPCCFIVNVCFWPIADMEIAPTDVRIRG